MREDGGLFYLPEVEMAPDREQEKKMNKGKFPGERQGGRRNVTLGCNGYLEGVGIFKTTSRTWNLAISPGLCAWKVNMFW